MFIRCYSKQSRCRFTRWVLLFFLVLLAGCQPELISQAHNSATQLVEKGVLVSDHSLVDDARLHFVVREQLADTLPLTGEKGAQKTFFVFIHGTPGDWRSFAEQLADNDLASRATLMAIDRPSWGGSFFEQERVEPSLGKQAALIAPLLLELKNKHPNSQVVLVGHSFGASLVPMIGMVYPDAADALVVLAGDLYAGYIDYKWYNRLLALSWVRPLLPREVCYANDEVIALAENVKNMAPLWHKLKQPMLVIQGMQDTLVNPLNADYAQELNTAAGVKVLRLDDAGHLLHLSHKQKVDTIILDWLESGFAIP